MMSSDSTIRSLKSGEATSLRVGMLVGTVSTAGGGVSEAVRSLSLAIRRIPGVSVEIFSLEDSRSDGGDFDDLPVHRVPIRGPAAFGYAPELVPVLLSRDLDILHVHGLWMYLSVAARRWARATGKTYVVSPHGMLDPWALENSASKKRFARLLYEDAHLRGAACLHALSAAEEEAIVAAGISTPVTILPNGVDLPSVPVGKPPWRTSMPPGSRVLLFLGRVTPKKRVLELIQAFDTAGAADRNWHLVIVGPVEAAYQKQLDAALEAAVCSERIHLVGPAYGDERGRVYAAAEAFILPSLSEGLPMAALEAFAFGLPALLSPQCNLPESFSAGAAMETGTDQETIAESLLHFFSMRIDHRLLMSQRARRLVAEKFDWNRIGFEMVALYRRLVRQPDEL
ncbi:glycosyltransferase [Chelativorans sp. YIM 93263]|uniref:glycosyltransferase n=1 Tax=Chelativorans sp. YIM 93263 TaxID=2906648 RepID=UPI002379A122|nr:glycosyltransferase [Chelativorans sp. YIM 93263]